jgi:alpha-1,3-rhamnosyl/mannosyltransferase
VTRTPLVGFDARKIRDFGIGTYIRQLLQAMARRRESEDYRFRVYLRGADRELLADLPPRFETVAEESRGYSLAELTRLPWRLWRDRLDLFHATHYVLPPLPRGRAVVTIHDIIHLLYPEFLPSRAAHVYAKRNDPEGARARRPHHHRSRTTASAISWTTSTCRRLGST